MRREGGNRRLLVGADSLRTAAVAAVFRGQNQRLPVVVEIALRPAEVGAAPQFDQFLGGFVLALQRLVQLGPVLIQLVAAVLGRKNPPGESKEMPSPLRSPVEKRSAGEKCWSNVLAS